MATVSSKDYREFIEDKENAGYVVILMDGVETRYLSASEYEAWRKDTLGDAQKIEVEYKPVTGGAEK